MYRVFLIFKGVEMDKLTEKEFGKTNVLLHAIIERIGITRRRHEVINPDSKGIYLDAQLYLKVDLPIGLERGTEIRYYDGKRWKKATYLDMNCYDKICFVVNDKQLDIHSVECSKICLSTQFKLKSDGMPEQYYQIEQPKIVGIY